MGSDICFSSYLSVGDKLIIRHPRKPEDEVREVRCINANGTVEIESPFSFKMMGAGFDFDYVKDPAARRQVGLSGGAAVLDSVVGSAVIQATVRKAFDGLATIGVGTFVMSLKDVVLESTSHINSQQKTVAATKAGIQEKYAALTHKYSPSMKLMDSVSRTPRRVSLGGTLFSCSVLFCDTD